MFSKRQIKVQRTARYCTYGELTEKTEHICFTCHGYRQLAPFFIKKFGALNPEKVFVVAPEALSRFYIEGFTGRVGAAWMTKESRESEIKDYVNYLTQVYELILKDIDTKNLEISILGFSQGGTTASRWLMKSDIHFDRFILWAGNFPHEANFEIAQKRLENKEFTFVYGDEDEFLNEKTIEHQLNFLEKNKLYPQVMQFSGKHDIDSETLLKLF